MVSSPESRARQLRILGLSAGVPLFLLAGVLASFALPRSALRTTVELCAAMMAGTNLPLPCSRVEWRAGVQIAILDPPVPGKHRLVVPVAPVIGIEDDVLRGPAGSAYFSVAWETALERAGGRWASAGLAVNSARVRSQDQLHFHADCLSALGKASLHGLEAASKWRRRGRDWILSVDGPAGSVNPFELIRHIPGLSSQTRFVNLGVFGVGSGDSKWIILANTGRRSFEDYLTTACPA